jgi:hypothetical protein
MKLVLKIKFSFNRLNLDGDLSVQMEKFFVASKLNPEGKLVGILKCIQQEIICPAVMDLREKIYTKFRYKDLKVVLDFSCWIFFWCLDIDL